METPKFGADTPIGYLQDFQSEYDENFLTHNEGDFDDIRHTFNHLVKLVGKLATYVEQTEHGIEVTTDQLTDEVTPDLLLHALHLANIFQTPLEELYQRRVEANIRRILPDQSQP